MTKLMDLALEAVAQLSPDEQDELARTILGIVGGGEPYVLTDDERTAIAVSRAQAERGEFADDAEIEALWAKYT